MPQTPASRIAACLLAVLGAGAGPGQRPAGAAPQAGVLAPAPAAPMPIVLGVVLNGVDLRAETIVMMRGRAPLVPVEDLSKWRLIGNPAAAVMIDDRPYVPLGAIAGISFRIDEAAQQLVLTALPDAFETTSLSTQQSYLPPGEAIATGFLNYDLSVEHGAGRDIAAGFVEIGMSDDSKLIYNSMTLGNALRGKRAVRFDSYLVRDDPAHLRRLVIGDSLTRGSAWLSPVRYGGIRLGTEFALQPGLLTFPSPTFDGRAALPSNVEIFVNNVLNYQAQVREGPFTLDRLPTVNGAGAATLVVRDALGVERQVVSSFYISTRLLRPGLSDYSLEAGAERRNYGAASFDYARPFAAASIRHGATSWLTLETRGEAARDLRNAGVGLSAVLGTLGEVGAAFAGSQADSGWGHIYRVHAARTAPRWSIALSYQHQTIGFAQLGYRPNERRPITQVQASSGLSPGSGFGSLTASLTYLRTSDATRSRVQAMNYSRQFGDRMVFGAFLFRADSHGGADGASARRRTITAGASLSLAFASRTTARLQADNQSRRAELRRMLPSDTGFSYDLLINQGDVDQQGAGVGYRGRAIEASASLARFNGATAARLLASGSLIVADGSILPTRRLANGFAIVEVPGAARVTVLQDNRPVAITNRHGFAIVSNLRPYEANRLGVVPGELSLDATILKDTLTVVPRFQAGVRARFEIKGTHAGTVILTLPDGMPIEPGTTILVTGREPSFAGFDGAIFLNALVEGMELVAQRPDGACRARVPAPPTGEILPRIGPLICRPESAR